MSKKRYNILELERIRAHHNAAIKIFCKNIAGSIIDTLNDAELSGYQEEVPQIGDLIYILVVGIEIAPQLNKHFERRRVITKIGRSIEPVEHLNIASLLIEAYCSLEAECCSALTECKYNAPAKLIRSWDHLCEGFESAVYGVLLRADLHLATLWRKGELEWLELGREIEKKI